MASEQFEHITPEALSSVARPCKGRQGATSSGHSLVHVMRRTTFVAEVKSSRQIANTILGAGYCVLGTYQVPLQETLGELNCQRPFLK